MQLPSYGKKGGDELIEESEVESRDGEVPTAEELWRAEVNKAIFITRREERELADRYHAGDIDAGWTIIMAHLPFITRYCKKYVTSSMPLGDFVQHCIIHLMEKAMPGFDPYVSRFIGYSKWHLRQACLAVAGGANRAFPLSVDAYARVRKARRFISEGYSLEECCQSLANEFGVSLEGIVAISHLFRPSLSLDYQRSSMEDAPEMSLAERVAASDPPIQQQAKGDGNWLAKVLDSALDELSQPVQETIIDYAGLFGRGPMLQPEIAKERGQRRATISLQYIKGCKKLREILSGNPQVVNYFGELGYELTSA